MGSTSSKSTKPEIKARVGTVSDVDRAVLDLKNSRDRLQRYRSKLEADEEKLLRRAKEAKDNGKKNTALGLLRLKKFKARELEGVENQLLTVLQMVGTIDSKQNEQQLLTALRSGKDALAQMQRETTVDDVLDLMDQIQEQNEVEKEVSDILSGVPSLSVEDEAIVEEELAALEAELNGHTIPDLPQVPNSKLPEIATPTRPEKVPTKQEKVAIAS
mmetsp:Transcript_22453/g.33936  ORF Transcript_22453/g.33936 Transcript_22453/m.33936 type:complete len:216 (+) Transcript_22453:26-673(+)